MKILTIMKNEKSKKLLKILSILASILLVGIITEICCLIIEYNSSIRIITNWNIIKNNFNIIRSVIISAIFLIIYIINYFSKKNNWHLSEKIYKYRYIIAFVIFAICVILKINGSSIGCWTTADEDEGLIIGISRNIRSDEWGVTTPMIFSQEKNDYKFTSNFPQNTETEVFTLIGAPVKDISMIFRIFQIGYVLFGNDMGLSFAWCGRFLALFLATFEFGMLITKQNKKLSLLAAILISFSPTIQWWYGGLIDMIVAGEIGTILLDKFLKETKFRYKILQIVGIFIALGNYILTMYPAWMVPLFYCFIPVIIWVIYENRKNIKINKKDIILICIIAVIFISLLLRIGFKAKDTIIATLNTVYPGHRTDLGKGNLLSYFKFALNSVLMYSVTLGNMKIPGFENHCEAAAMIDFWPIVLIFLIMYFVQEKNNKKDFFIKISVCFALFLNIYYIFGLPEIIGKITFMSYSTPERTFQVLGLVNIFILLRLMSIYDIELKDKEAKIIAIIFTIITIVSIEIMLVYSERIWLQYVINNQFSKVFILNLVKSLALVAIVIFLIYSFAYYTLLTYKKNINYLLIAISILMIFSTGLVNPIRVGGAKIIENDDLIKVISDINSEEDGVWASIGIAMKNATISVGVRTINSIQFFPNIDMWEKIDTNKQYEEIYNRYAHIEITLEEQDEKFELVSTDAIRVSLTPEELKKLDIDYIVCTKSFEKEKYENLELEELYVDENYMIYRIL